MRAQTAKLHEVAPTHSNGHYSGSKTLQGSLDSGSLLQRWFLPTKETRLMAEEVNRTSGLFLPYPALALLLTLTLALSGGIIGLYSQLSAMQTTLLLRDADYQRQQKQSWEKIEQLQVYIQNDREKIAKLESQIDKRRN